jgi:hypothetical protein
MAIHLRYFERRDGTILLAPDDISGLRATCPPDCIEREANTLAEVDALQRRLQAATYERCQRELLRDEAAFAESRQRVIDSIHQTLASSATTQYERDFLREYVKLREEKREKYRQRFACDTAYLELRENDKPRNAEELLGESL